MTPACDIVFCRCRGVVRCDGLWYCAKHVRSYRQLVAGDEPPFGFSIRADLLAGAA